MRRLGEVEQLDARLSSLAQAETGLRLRLGRVLEVLGRGKHFELGFSSVAAYVQPQGRYAPSSAIPLGGRE